ncbi:MAG: tetratricopeptide repeat protein [Planctomycetota bacterium]
MRISLWIFSLILLLVALSWPGHAGEAAAKETQPGAPAGTVDQRLTHNHAALVAYTMGGNLVRQGRHRDALQYYNTAISVDPKFVEAMNDAALIYKMERDYETGKHLLQRAVLIEPEMSGLHHSLGEILQAQGLEQLSRNELDAGTVSIQEAIKSYGRAIDVAVKQGILATRAASYFRLGEVCYYANNDPAGARQYWEQVLRLHTPTPILGEKPENFWRLTRTRVDLVTWQNWAKQYLNQLNTLAKEATPQPSSGAPATHAAPAVGVRPRKAKSKKRGTWQSSNMWQWQRFNR